jgi:hypothetical protein
MNRYENFILMFTRRSISAIFLLFLFTAPGLVAVDAPTIAISSPANGSVLLMRSVNVTGTAAGSDAQWLQTSRADFEGGTGDSIVVGEGDVRLSELGMYDDFDDNSIDCVLWNATCTAKEY